jgi:deoxycytidylate deaminase
MNINKSLINSAISEAKKSTFDFRLGAIIYKKSKIISRGCNHQHRYRRKLHPKYQNWIGTIHAEAECILTANKPLKNTTMLVVRLGGSDNLLLAKPCIYCQDYINNTGIKRVIYSISNNSFGIIERGNYCGKVEI